MFKVEYIILCEVADYTPQGTNLVNVFQVIHAPEFPVSFGTRLAHVMLRASKPVYGTDIALKITVEGDKVLQSSETTLKNVMALKDYNVPVDIDFPDLNFNKPGKYYFKFNVDDKFCSSTILQVRNIKENS